MNDFLIDLKQSVKYVKHFCVKYNEIRNEELIFNEVTGNDHGIDAYNDNVKVDVKAYARPLFIERFKGIYIEGQSKISNNAGWLYSDNETTHYAIYVNCLKESVDYDELYFLSKEALKLAVEFARENGELTVTSCDNNNGWVLPYKYLEFYSEYIEKRGDTT